MKLVLMLQLSCNRRVKPGEPVAQPSCPASMSETQVWKGLQRRHLYLSSAENSIWIGRKERKVEKLDKRCFLSLL